MQLQLRTKDGENVVIDTQYVPINPHQPEDGSELISATIIDAQLSRFSHNDFFAMVGEICDYFSASPASQKPSADWHKDEWLPQTRTNGKPKD